MQQRLSSSRQSLSVFLLLFWLLRLIAVLNQHPLHFQCTWTAGLFLLVFFLFLPAFPLHPSLGTETSIAGLPPSSHAQVFLADPWLLSLPASLPIKPSTCSMPPPRALIPRPLLLAPAPHLLPTCQAGPAPQFHQVAWGWGWARCHLNSLHPRQPEMESVINGTVPGSISSGNFKLMMFK